MTKRRGSYRRITDDFLRRPIPPRPRDSEEPWINTLRRARQDNMGAFLSSRQVAALLQEWEEKNADQ
jgi:hypothetical protein